MRPRRLELPLRLRNSDLNAARLPIPPRPHPGSAGLIAEGVRNEKRFLPAQKDEKRFLRAQKDVDAAVPARHIAVMVEWIISNGLTGHDTAVARMEARVAEILAGTAPEAVWLVEHPPIYTAGTSARPEDLLQARFPVIATGRGGQYTYHGPGQRIVYVMLDLNRRGRDVRAFVGQLEEWVVDALASFGVSGQIRPGRVGVWAPRPDKPPLPDGQMREDKIAAIGVKLRRWVSFHGISINVDPDLGHYAGIVPCGISGHGVTSLVDLGLPVGMADLDLALRQGFTHRFPPAG